MRCRFTLSMCVAMASACSGQPNAAQLTLTDATGTETISFNDIVDGINEAPIIQGDEIQFPYQGTGNSRILGSLPQVRVSLQARIIDPARSITESRYTGVGPFVGRVYFGKPGAGPVHIVSHQFFVDDKEFTGDGNHPFVFRGASLGPEGDSNDRTFKFKVIFEMTSDCEDDIDASACGSNRVLDPPRFKAKLGPLQGALGCPTDVVKAFVGQGEGAIMTMEGDNAAFKVEGSSLSFNCVSTNGSARHLACGNQTSVKVGNCTWRASGTAFAGGYANTAEGGWIWVGATTDKACSPINWCNSEWVALPTQ